MSNLKVVFAPHPPIIIPEIGRGQESKAQSTIDGMKKLGQLVGKMQPDTIIFISPHGSTFSNGTNILQADKLEGDFSGFGYPDITFKKKVNQKLSQNIHDILEEHDFTTIFMDDALAKNYGAQVALDHGSMVPMYYIDQYYQEYDIVHISPGFTSLEENYYLGQKIQEVVKKQDQSVVMVCSGDLSHALKNDGPYQFHPSGPDFDTKVEEAITNKDPMILLTMEEKFIEQAGQCGLRPFLMGFGFVDALDYQSEVFSYEGPFGVGYLTGHFTQNQDLKQESLLEKVENIKIADYKKSISSEDDYIKLARMTIESYIKDKTRLNFQDVAGEFSEEFIEEAKAQEAGTFVTIHKDASLRGCIGTISSTQENLIEEIINNAISASGHDPRFNEVQAEELMDLDISVDVLMPAEKIHSTDQLDVKKYGVIVEKGHKRGLLLPNLEGVDTIKEQVRIAMDKAGITKEDGAQLYRFEVIRHEKKD